jgi:hypothetical protein
MNAKRSSSTARRAPSESSRATMTDLGGFDH